MDTFQDAVEVGTPADVTVTENGTVRVMHDKAIQLSCNNGAAGWQVVYDSHGANSFEIGVVGDTVRVTAKSGSVNVTIAEAL